MVSYVARNMVTVDKGIPIPQPRRKYPWKKMKVGDSFFVPNDCTANVAGGAGWAGLKYNMRFVCRKMDGGVRVWRVE